MIVLKTYSEIHKIKKSSKLVSKFLDKLEFIIKPNLKINAIERLANEFVMSENVIAGFKNYHKYPFSVCTSINDQVVHGFPIDRTLQDGDIVSVDFGVLNDGYYGDAARTYKVGMVSAVANRLIKITKECLYLGIAQATAGNRVGDISFAISSHATKNGFFIVPHLVGHGIGKNLHEYPNIPNMVTINKYLKLKEGMTIAIEPILTEGCQTTSIDDNGWTEYTTDGKLSAHFEHTIVITEDVAKILS